MFRIDSAKCTGCGACLYVCPQGAIDLMGDKAEINHGLCMECGMCLDVCAAGAVYEVAVVAQASGMYNRLAINRQRKEVGEMPGRGWFGWGGPGWGRGFGYGRGFGRGYGRGFGYGKGFGRGWWAMPHVGQYGATMPYMGYGYPYYGAPGAPYYTPYSAWPRY